MTIRLFEITEQLKALENIADSDELPPEVIADTLEGLQGDFETKAVQVAKFILSLDSQAEAIKDAAEAMARRSARIKKRAESIKAYLLFQFQAVNTKRIETAEIVIARRANPVAVQVTDEASVPAAYWRQPPPPPKQLDKASIKEALQTGKEVIGCFLESGEHLRITL